MSVANINSSSSAFGSLPVHSLSSGFLGNGALSVAFPTFLPELMYHVFLNLAFFRTSCFWEDCFLYSTYDVRYPDKIVGIVLLDGSSNRLYYYVNYRLKDIVGDTWCDVNAKVYIDTLIHSSYMYSYIGYHSTVPYGTVASSPMPSRIYNIVYLWRASELKLY